MNQNLVREEFNRWADLGRGLGMEKSHWQITLSTIQLMEIGAAKNIFDLGCGTGWATRILAAKAPSGIAVGADLSDLMIRQAKGDVRNPPNVNFIVTEAELLPCRANYFDVLLSVESIYYYLDIEAAFSESIRILRPGASGYFLINFYQENSYSHCWAEHLSLPVHLLSGKEYCDLLLKVGFASASHRRIIDTTPISQDFQPSQWHPSLQDMKAFQKEGALLVIGEK